MDHIEYKQLRESLGSQAKVASLLGITVVTLSRRESGRVPISVEMGLAIRSLSKDSLPAEKVAENIKKSLLPKKPISKFPYTEKMLDGILLNGRRYTLENICEECNVGKSKVMEAWKNNQTPYSILGGNTATATWSETSIDDLLS